MKKTMCILYYIIMALPIPVSMLTWIGTIISIANIGATGGEGVPGYFHRLVAVLSMLLAGTYIIPYVFSLIRMIMVKKITFSMFLPIIHIVVTCICIWGWTCFDKM